jgi:hypothetical protein
MGAFTFKLEQEDGTPAEPPTCRTAVPNWSPGNTIRWGGDRMLRVVEVRPAGSADASLIPSAHTERAAEAALGVTVYAFFAAAPVWTNPSMRAPPSETAANVEST